LGLHDSALKRSDEQHAFGIMTLPHQLMKLVLVEHVYRSFRIIKGEPYHK
ncbi:23S rRNA (pseudouridine(1915)-N(3))-methyltransferase RlmH, partial [Lysinibacillus fusiformis]